MTELQKFIDILKKGHMNHFVREYENPIWKYIIYIDNDDSDYELLYLDWCAENCLYKYSVYSECFVIFEDESDAVTFKLRWL